MGKKIKSICFVTPKYATNDNPVNPFVDNLVTEIANQGVRCSVIAPHSVTEQMTKGVVKPPRQYTKTAPNGNVIHIYCPRYISFSNMEIAGFQTNTLTFRNFQQAVLKEYKRQGISADAFYGHFVAPYGIMAFQLGRKYGLPSFVANGESVLDFKGYRDTDVSDALNGMTGIVSVSSENKREIMESGYFKTDPTAKIGVFPNGIDPTLFYKMDQQQAREQLGFPQDAFIVAFVGHFSKRKGSRVLSQAIEQCGGGVHSIFLGAGEQAPNCPDILFQGKAQRDQVCTYLNAADVFVLPTLAEGCCNAIIEAMACGLPVISSNLPFNDDILDDTCSIRIDPQNTEEITKAIVLLKQDVALRQQLSQGALQKAAGLTIASRTKHILNFMEQQI